MQKYCIYSNEYVDESELNKEHIIPKKLGGQLDFSVLVSKEINSQLGSKIDAPFVNDTFVQLHSKSYNFKGHSKKVTPALKNSIIKETNEKVDISFKNNKMIFHKKWSKNSPAWTKTLEQCKAKVIECNFTMSQDIYVRFFAKLLLATGYYLYGDTFVQYGYHEDLRKVMNADKVDKIIDDPSLKIKILSSFKNPDAFMHIVTSDFEAFKNYHVIWSSFYTNAVVLGVSFFGNKFLSANCIISDNPEKFDIAGKGKVILKELSTDSPRRLIKVTQEDLLIKFAETYIPDFNISKIIKLANKNNS
ncbi:hypothetical protein IJ541_04330 [bacterium]|nr:hypothetical protein [bacterium]